jgi:pimeloyl-ACP methyl ester carboxylesterase
MDPMRRIAIRLAILLGLLACWASLHAHEAAPAVSAGQVERIATREGVSVPIYTYWQAAAAATVVLFSGGGGGYGQIGADGWPASGNFLIRTGKHWAGYPFNIVMVGRPSDGIDLSLGAVRIGKLHAADNLAIFKAIKRNSPLPIWLVGTSMGTISAAAAAIADSDNLLAGLVLTSAITAYKVSGAVPRQDLERIRLPTLVLHHDSDACWACQPSEAKQLAGQLKNAPIKKTIMVSGGSGATGNPCEPMHYHGYVGMQEATVDRIAAWILAPAE